MKTLLHKILYTLGGCALGVATAIFLLMMIIGLSERAHNWLTSSYEDILTVVVFSVCIIAGGIIGYRKCVRAIHAGRISYWKPLLIVCLSVALTFLIVLAGRYIAETYFPEPPPFPEFGDQSFFQNAKLPYDTIEDAVRASGGTYMVIDPSTASPSDIADTMEAGGLTASDDRGGNKTIVPGITIHDKLENRFQKISYWIKPEKSFSPVLAVESDDLPIFLTLYDSDGNILAVNQESDDDGKRLALVYDFLAGETYVAEVFINTDAIPDFDGDKTYSTSYSIGFTGRFWYQ